MPQTAPARECGGCTMCCKVMTVRELQKPMGSWCSHCKPGRGCGIYEARPAECRTFICAWIQRPELGPEWRPDKCKMVLMQESIAGRIVIKCDPGFPHAWRKEPYRGQIARWAADAGPRGGEVIVLVNHDMTVIARDKELHVGIVGERDGFAVDYDPTGRPLRCRVQKAAAE
jgi:hypothetical protein